MRAHYNVELGIKPSRRQQVGVCGYPPITVLFRSFCLGMLGEGDTHSLEPRPPPGIGGGDPGRDQGRCGPAPSLPRSNSAAPGPRGFVHPPHPPPSPRRSRSRWLPTPAGSRSVPRRPPSCPTYRLKIQEGFGQRRGAQRRRGGPAPRCPSGNGSGRASARGPGWPRRRGRGGAGGRRLRGARGAGAGP